MAQNVAYVQPIGTDHARLIRTSTTNHRPDKIVSESSLYSFTALRTKSLSIPFYRESKLFASERTLGR